MRAAATRMFKPILSTLSRYRFARAPIHYVHRYVSGKDQWNRRHPYDQANGISTNGYLPGWLLRTGSSSDSQNSGYAGCQPSCIREGLSSVPEPERFIYFDVGCGKGRSLAVASEFPFRRIVGVEIAPQIAAAAIANADVLRQRYPNRTPIEVIAGDASGTPLPEGDLVVFLYHSFGKPLLELLVSRLLAARDGREVYFVYENPVNGLVLDAAPGFMRWFAKTVPSEPAEVGFAPDDSETVVVWRAGGKESASPFHGADAPIGGTGWRAMLETGAAA